MWTENRFLIERENSRLVSEATLTYQAASAAFNGKAAFKPFKEAIKALQE